MRRPNSKPNIDWSVVSDANDSPSMTGAQLAVLMDIRGELQRLNAVFNCGNFLAIPSHLVRIAENTSKPKRARKKATS